MIRRRPSGFAIWRMLLPLPHGRLRGSVVLRIPLRRDRGGGPDRIPGRPSVGRPIAGRADHGIAVCPPVRPADRRRAAAVRLRCRQRPWEP